MNWNFDRTLSGPFPRARTGRMLLKALRQERNALLDALDRKGERAGHPFRGNQHTGGIGGDMGTTVPLTPFGGTDPHRSEAFAGMSVSMSSLTPKEQDKVRAAVSKHLGMENPEAEIEQNYADLLAAALKRTELVDIDSGSLDVVKTVEPGEFVANSRRWYEDARAVTEELAAITGPNGEGVSVGQAAGVLALTSANNKFRMDAPDEAGNILTARKIIEFGTTDAKFTPEETEAIVLMMQGYQKPGGPGGGGAKKSRIDPNLTADDLRAMVDGKRPSDIDDEFVVALAFNAMSSLHGWKAGTFVDKTADAIALCRGTLNADLAVSGAKQRSFARSMNDPKGTADDPTIDSIMFEAAYMGARNNGLGLAERVAGGRANDVGWMEGSVQTALQTGAPSITRPWPGHEGEKLVASGPKQNASSVQEGAKWIAADAVRRVTQRPEFAALNLTPVEAQAIIWSEYQQQNPASLRGQTSRALGTGLSARGKFGARGGRQTARRSTLEVLQSQGGVE